MDITCNKCDYWRGSPNTLNKGVWEFICSYCKEDHDSSIERAESRRYEK